MAPPSGTIRTFGSSKANDHETPPRVLVTAGPTQEPIDDVRFIGNRSSGRMGLAIASAAHERGWPTTLLLGPVCLTPPDGPEVHHFRTTTELDQLLKTHWPSSDLLFMAAAVADFIPANTCQGKLSRLDGPRSLDLQPAPDLLKGLASVTRNTQTVVGFALEPAELLAQKAARKLEDKSLDAMVANPLETMDSATVDATLLVRSQAERHPPKNLPKAEFATWLLDEIASILSSPKA